MRLFLAPTATVAAAMLGSAAATEANVATCSQFTDVVIGTGSVATSTVKSVGECCSACYNYGYGCKAFTFETSTGSCFVKDNVNGNTTEARCGCTLGRLLLSAA